MKKLFLLHLLFAFNFCGMDAGQLPCDNEKSKIYDLVALAVQQKSSQIAKVLSDVHENARDTYQLIVPSMQDSVQARRHIREKVDQLFNRLTASPDTIDDFLDALSNNHQSPLLIDGAFEDDNNLYEEVFRKSYMMQLPEKPKEPKGSRSSTGRRATTHEGGARSTPRQSPESHQPCTTEKPLEDSRIKSPAQEAPCVSHNKPIAHEVSHQKGPTLKDRLERVIALHNANKQSEIDNDLKNKEIPIESDIHKPAMKEEVYNRSESFDEYDTMVFHNTHIRNAHVEHTKKLAEKIEAQKSALVAYGYDFKNHEKAVTKLQEAQEQTKKVEEVVEALLITGIPIVPLVIASGLLGPVVGVSIGAIYVGLTTRSIVEYDKKFAVEVEAYRELAQEQAAQIQAIETIEKKVEQEIENKAQREKEIEQRIKLEEEKKSQEKENNSKFNIKNFLHSIKDFLYFDSDDSQATNSEKQNKLIGLVGGPDTDEFVDKAKDDPLLSNTCFSVAAGMGTAVAISNIAYSVFIGSLGHFQETILHDKEFAVQHPEIANALAGSFSGLDKMMNHKHTYKGPGVSANIKPFFEQSSAVSQPELQLMSLAAKTYCDFVISKVSERMGGDKNLLDACGNPKYISILNSYAHGVLIQGFDEDLNITKTIVAPKSDKIAPYEFSLDREVQKKHEEQEDFQNKVDHRVAQGRAMNHSNQFAHELPCDFSPATNKKGEPLRAEDGGQLSAQGESWKWSNKKQEWIVKSVDGKTHSVPKSTITTVAQAEKEKQAGNDEQDKKDKELAQAQQASMNQDEGAQTSQGCSGMDIAQPAQNPQGCAGMDVEGNNSPTILTSPVPGVEKPNPGCGPIDPVPTKTDTAHETPEDFTHQYFESQKDDGKNSQKSQPSVEPQKGTPEWNKQHPYGEFRPSAKHHPNSPDHIGKPPRDGQEALDNSFGVDKSDQRVAIQDDKIIILKYEEDGIYHGYIHEDLTTLPQKVKNALVREGFMKSVTSKKLLKK